MKQRSKRTLNKYVSVNEFVPDDNDDSLWMHDENNPDYKLAIIHAANIGFKSKMSVETGSFLLTEFKEKI